MNPRYWLTVFAHEWRRSLAARHFFSWFFLIGFPVLIIGLLRYTQRENPEPMEFLAWGSVVFFLIPGIGCMLSLLLTAAPFLQAELERRSWIYLSVRPGARNALLFGKHLYAVSRTVLMATITLVLCLAIGGFYTEIRYLLVMLVLILLGSLAYGSIYVFIGILIPRRAMVVAVIYSGVEFLVSLIPALINRLTVQYRLRSLLIEWMDWAESPDWRSLSGLFSEVPWWQHVAILLGTTVGLLILSSIILNRREYIAIRDE
jgi:ABC-type transport system involved in multi-copper enzyme maturation permease subunit